MAVEVQFYLVLPIIAFAVVSSLRRGRPLLTAGVFVLIVLGSVSAYGFSFVAHRLGHGFDHFALAPSMFQFLPVFAIGILASLYFVMATDGRWASRDGTRLAKAFGAGGLLLLGLLVILDQTILTHVRYGYVIVDQGAGLAYGALLIGILLGWKAWRAILAHPLFRFVGMISYSLYIWNLVVLQHYLVPALSGAIGSAGLGGWCRTGLCRGTLVAP